MKTRNFYRQALLTLGVILIGGITAQAVTPVGINGQLHVDGAFLKNQHGEKVTLRGQSLGWSTWWPQYWNPDVVAWVASDWKIDVIRAAMGVHTNPGFLNDSTRKTNLVRTVVNAAIANEIYVIIDWHSHQLHLEAALEFFTRMAREFGHHPNVIYEIYNEPIEETWDQLKAYSDTLIKTIRRYDPDNIIIVPTGFYAQNVDIAADDPLVGHTNIMYAFHFYADGHRAPLRNRLSYAIGKGLPIFVTESSGMWYDGDGPINYIEWWAYIDLMEANHISWLNWQIADKRDESCSVLLPGASVQGGWGDDELNESGKFIRWLLRSFKVPTVRVDSIFIADEVAEVTLMVGDSLQLAAVILPQDATNPNVAWRSTNPSRARVTDSGLVRAVAPGTATIRAIAQDRAKTASVSVTVMEVPTSAPTIEPQVHIHPNPTTGLVNISLDRPMIGGRLTVYNAIGMRVAEVPIASQSFTFCMSSFQPGVYILTISGEGSQSAHRILRK